jgi:DNA-binding CsgD family transcriptional regulator
MKEADSESIITPFKNGIKLLRPKRQCSPQNKTVFDFLNLPCSTYFETTDGIIKTANERNAELCRYDSVNQAIGKKYFNYLPKHSIDRIRKHDYLTINEGTKVLDEYLSRHDGNIIHIVSIKSPWYDLNGKIIGLFGISIIAGKDTFSEPLHQLSTLGLLNNAFSKVPSEIKLSKRQSECAKLLSQGMTAKEIAAAINLSPRTIEYYIDNIKLKLNCRNKTELAATLTKIFPYT